MRRNDQATDEGIDWPRSEPPSLGLLLSHGRDALAELTEGLIARCKVQGTGGSAANWEPLHLELP